jgi:mannose-6-phosphate isomerase-like protein (cupin superfamily)
MYTLNENDREYRHGNHGPKYLEQGPRMNFGLVRLLPGEVVSGHMHQHMQESFYILEGTVTMTIEGEEVKLKPGDYIHIEPGEGHIIRNPGVQPVKMVVTAAPFKEGDKIML